MSTMTPVNPIPKPRAPIDERSLLTSITFFLTPAQRAAVIRSLRAMRERDRTGALLELVRRNQPRPRTNSNESDRETDR